MFEFLLELKHNDVFLYELELEKFINNFDNLVVNNNNNDNDIDVICNILNLLDSKVNT